MPWQNFHKGYALWWWIGNKRTGYIIANYRVFRYIADFILFFWAWTCFTEVRNSRLNRSPTNAWDIIHEFHKWSSWACPFIIWFPLRCIRRNGAKEMSYISFSDSQVSKNSLGSFYVIAPTEKNDTFYTLLSSL